MEDHLKTAQTKWMCEQIKEYNTVLEIGSGTGHSTLALIEHGHKVIAVDNNEYCLMMAENIIKEAGYKYGGNLLI